MPFDDCLHEIGNNSHTIVPNICPVMNDDDDDSCDGDGDDDDWIHQLQPMMLSMFADYHWL